MGYVLQHRIITASTRRSPDAPGGGFRLSGDGAVENKDAVVHSAKADCRADRQGGGRNRREWSGKRDVRQRGRSQSAALPDGVQLTGKSHRDTAVEKGCRTVSSAWTKGKSGVRGAAGVSSCAGGCCRHLRQVPRDLLSVGAQPAGRLLYPVPLLGSESLTLGGHTGGRKAQTALEVVVQHKRGLQGWGKSGDGGRWRVRPAGGTVLAGPEAGEIMETGIC
ncbi:MAG: hypothetical protein JWM59_416 [Verrucomicrobiales bacterium]|nr:hypothetical protein [Verrucomicrobiales bacterium]